MTIRTLKIHISASTPPRPYYVCATVEVPGIGEIEMKDLVSRATIDALFAEIATAAELKIRGQVTPILP